MSKSWATPPSVLCGLTEQDDWLALIINRVTWTWGSTVERWERETKEVPYRKSNKPQTTTEPLHSPEWITRAIYGPLPGDAAPDSPPPPPPNHFDPFAVAGLPTDNITPPRFREQDVASLIASLPKERPG